MGDSVCTSEKLQTGAGAISVYRDRDVDDGILTAISNDCFLLAFKGVPNCLSFLYTFQ